MDNLEISISGGGGGGGGVGGASRWNPTKEQIDMLENLYKQGLRTPTAEQIQQITSRLRSFGHIEGKNVFYWFQNHKARQRQKQKQDHVNSYVNRFLQHHHKSSSPAAAAYPPPNVIFSPFYMPDPEMGLCHQQQQQNPKLLLPRTLKRRPPLMVAAEKLEKNNPPIIHPPNYNHHPILQYPTKPREEECKETLELFPMHPSWKLLENSPSSSSVTASAAVGNFAALSSSPFAAATKYQGVSEAGDHTFFDFLCGNGSSRDA